MYVAVQRKVCYTNTVVVSKSNLRMCQYIYLNSKKKYGIFNLDKYRRYISTRTPYRSI